MFKKYSPRAVLSLIRRSIDERHGSCFAAGFACILGIFHTVALIQEGGHVKCRETMRRVLANFKEAVSRRPDMVELRFNRKRDYSKIRRDWLPRCMLHQPGIGMGNTPVFDKDLRRIAMVITLTTSWKRVTGFRHKRVERVYSAHQLKE